MTNTRVVPATRFEKNVPCRYDERRLLLECDGGERKDEDRLVSRALDVVSSSHTGPMSECRYHIAE